jgi:hypothetical protein
MLENYSNHVIYARLSNDSNTDTELVKIENECFYEWERKYGKKFLLQIERKNKAKNGPIFKVEIGKSYEFDEDCDLFDHKNEFHVPLTHYTFSDKIFTPEEIEKQKELEKTHFKFIFFNYSYKNFNVTINGETRKVEKYDQDIFFIKEKNNQKLRIEHKEKDLELIFEYTVKSYLSYTIDATFNLIQNNNDTSIKPDYMNVPNEKLNKIIEEGNIGIY